MKMLKLKDISEKYEVSRGTLRYWISIGLPYIKIRQTIYIEEQDLIDFLRKNKRIRTKTEELESGE